jgi:IS5 family transposase
LGCIGNGKAHKSYEFGAKVSVATTLDRGNGGQFIAYVQALPCNPYDGYTLATVIPTRRQYDRTAARRRWLSRTQCAAGLQVQNPHLAPKSELSRHREGDANNAILAVAGYNFHRVLRWLAELLRLFLPSSRGQH